MSQVANKVKPVYTEPHWDQFLCPQ